MEKRSAYKTKQREKLLGYMKTVQGKHVTVSDVCEFFKARGEAIGQATIYRQLEKLVDDGTINKYIVDINSPACFEYTGGEHCCEDTCFHCKCEKCGKLIHMHCDELNELESHLYEHHQFRMDPKRTVFYGICDECQAADGQS